jgi:transposase
MVTLEVCMEISFLDGQGYSQRGIARELGIPRKTVKKYLDGGGSPEYRRRARRQTILDSYREIIQDWLKQDNYRGSWIHDRLVRMGYQGSYDTVKNYVRQIKEGMSRLAYLRFETVAGEQAQVDWADFQVAEPGVSSSTLYLFAFVLGYSRALYAELVPRCTLEAFLDAHIRAFGYLGGVPAEILYDNKKHVVTDRKDGRVDFNIEFLHFAHHYRFKASACPPYSPWVKGKVERPIDYIRERFWRGYSLLEESRSHR